MMKRQLLRVKQIADSTFQRSEKSEVLTEELSAAEKRVDLIRQSCAASGKKLSACTQRITPDEGKTTKKLPEAVLAQCMEEWGLHLGETSILGMTLMDCARIQESLAYNLLAYKAQVEDTVVEPLQHILKIDIANILKYRKQLTKLMSDMTSAKMRYQNAAKSCQQQSTPASFAKAELLKEEAEDSISRVDQCRDSLAAEMFNLISREPEMSRHFVHLCKLQSEYHKRSLSALEAALPEIEAQIRSCPHHPVFGFPLEEHLEVTKREIALVIEICICWLLDSAMDEEGLFRIGGSLTKIKKIKSAFDAGFWHLVEEERDPHTISGVLKMYLRSLPEPLLTYALYDDWITAASIQDHDVRLQSLWTIVNSLPEPNLRNLRYLIKFLSKLSQNSDVNKMSTQNIAIVIGPNLLWPQVDDSMLGMNMTATNLYSSIVDTLVSYNEWFFPGEFDFHISTPTTPRHIEGFPPPFLSGSQLSLSTAKLSNGDSALDSSLSSSPTNSSPKSPSPRIPLRPRKKAAPVAPDDNFRNQITRSLSCGVFKPNTITQPSKTYSNNNGCNRLTMLSMSHEDLLSAGYGNQESQRVQSKSLSDRNGLGDPSNNTIDPNVRLRSVSQMRPPRRRKGLPPVAERTLRPLERPSVPPPERPNTICARPLSKEPDYSAPVVDLDNISISLDSSESETYNDCSMSFVDDSDNEDQHQPEEKASEKTYYNNPNVQQHGIQQPELQKREIQEPELQKREIQEPELQKQKIHQPEHQEQEIHQPALQKREIQQSELQKQIQRPESHQEEIQLPELQQENTERPNSHQENTQRPKSHQENTQRPESHQEIQRPEPQQPQQDHSSPDIQLWEGGGTPTWFDHYDGDKRQSNAIWFSNRETEELCFESADVFLEDPISNPMGPFRSHFERNGTEVDDSFRTIIEVGNGDGESEQMNTKVTGTAIKLRVNSQTQHTRL